MSTGILHRYIADTSQIEGFRDESISQVWVPIEELKENTDIVAVCPARLSGWIAIGTSFTRWGEITNINEFVRKRYSHGYDYPYAVGDELWFCAESEQENGDMLIENSTRIIASVDAFPLAMMTVKDMDLMTGNDDQLRYQMESGLRSIPSGIIGNWNTRYPDQQWAEYRWCWKIGLGRKGTK